MMTPAGIAAAQRLLRIRDADRAMLARLEGSERLAIMLGEHAQSVEIVVTAGYSASIRWALADSFRQRIAQAEADLKKMGVEP